MLILGKSKKLFVINVYRTAEDSRAFCPFAAMIATLFGSTNKNCGFFDTKTYIR